MSQAQVNGEQPSSAFLKQLLNYPVVNDGVNTFKSHPYGQRSLQLSDHAYQTFAKPVIPYLQKPYQYVSPYVRKADEFGAATLSRVDERFPAVKKPTNELYNDTKSIVFYPYRKAFDTRDHIVDVYSKECEKVGGSGTAARTTGQEASKEKKPGLFVYGKAAVGTAIIVTTETVLWVRDILTAKKEQAREVVDNKMNAQQ